MVTSETWADIAGYEFYQVSDIGRVRSLDHIVRSSRGEGTRLVLGQILKPDNSGRYPVVDLHGIERKRHLVHRLVARAFIQNAANKKTVNHIDGIKTNNRAENLEWATQAENIAHSMATGLGLRGERVGTSKLKQSDILYIRAQRGIKKGVDLARELCIAKTTVTDIQLRKSWKHI